MCFYASPGERAGMKLITATPWGVYTVWWRHFQVYRSTWLVSMLPPTIRTAGVPAGLWLWPDSPGW